MTLFARWGSKVGPGEASRLTLLKGSCLGISIHELPRSLARLLKKWPPNRSVLPNRFQNAQKWGSRRPNREGSEKGMKEFFNRLHRYVVV